MGLLNFFRSPEPTSADIARERLQIVVAHQRADRNKPSYLPKLQRDLLKVIRKYVEVDEDAIRVNVEREDHHEVLELNVVLPEPEAPRLAAR